MVDYVITVYRSPLPPLEFCPSNILPSWRDAGLEGDSGGEWYWNLDDGHLPAGPYLTAVKAEAAAREEIAIYHAVMGGVARWVRVDLDGAK